MKNQCSYRIDYDVRCPPVASLREERFDLLLPCCSHIKPPCRYRVFHRVSMNIAGYWYSSPPPGGFQDCAIAHPSQALSGHIRLFEPVHALRAGARPGTCGPLSRPFFFPGQPTIFVDNSMRIVTILKQSMCFSGCRFFRRAWFPFPYWIPAGRQIRCIWALVHRTARIVPRPPHPYDQCPSIARWYRVPT